MITNEDILYTAGLARLGIRQDEIEKLAVDMTRIIKFVENISALDTSSVQPLYNINEQTNVMRGDVLKASLKQEDIGKLAPAFKNGSIVVPRILD